jgi:outer membrane receptor protein involved in Fe transport
MRQTFILILLFLLTSMVNAQTAKISGSVKDAEGKGIQGVTLSLLKVKDSSLAKLAVSDKNGDYEFINIKPGKYIISATSVGYGKTFSQAIETAGTNIEMPSIALVSKATSLAEVSVQVRRPLVETRIDKMIVNVDASPTNAGNSALDVLEKSPGITVDKDGNISLKGKQGVIVLMDGKQTYLGGQDLANLLRNLPASQLDQIEIMTQPSAKYDASGNSGILNLRTKKNTLTGFNGSINLSYIQARYPKSPNSFNFNYRKGKVNLFSNLSYSYWEGFNEIKIDRNLVGGTQRNQESNMRFSSQNFSARVGLDYSVNKKTNLGFNVNATYNPRRNSGTTVSRHLDANDVLLDYNEAITRSKDDWRNFGGNLNFRRLLDKPGKEITADFDIVRYSSESNQISNNFEYDAAKNMMNDPYLLRGILPQEISIYTGKVDYAVPVGKDGKFEAGLKSSYVKTDNNAPYQYFDTTGTSNSWLTDARSDHFIYTENINAGYLNYSRQIKKFGMQLGVRVEHTHSLGNSVKTGSKVPKDYVQPFPTAYFSYKVNDNNSMGLSYGRRLDRPNYQDLNPFQRILDKYTYQQGNPYLTPQFTHNVELSHNYKGKLNTTLNYTYTDDIINDILKPHPTDAQSTFQTKENVAKRRSIGIATSYNAPINKWWATSLYVNAFNNHFEGFVNNRPLSVDVTSYMANMSQRFTFPKGWTAEVNGFYRSKSQEGGLIVADPMGVVSFGASKTVLKNKGTIKLNVSDPFYIQKFHGYTKFGEIDADIRSNWDNRRVGLSFSYRFSKGQNVTQRQRKTASQDEQNRVGGGQQQ